MANSKPRKQLKNLILLISAGNTLLTRNINNLADMNLLQPLDRQSGNRI